MSLYLVIKSGPSQGETYELSSGLSVGRKGARIRLEDKKVSTLHAVVESDSSGHFRLVDQNSKNGLTLRGVKCSSIPLKAGVEFEIGDTQFSVFESKPTPNQSPSSPTVEGGQKRWNDVLAHFLRKFSHEVRNEPHEMAALNPAVILDFMRGPQAETRWVLGYGPRQIGKLSVDLPLLDGDAPGLVFKIVPHDDGPLIQALCEEVTLNGSRFTTETLKVGDQIQIANTLIEVDFSE